MILCDPLTEVLDGISTADIPSLKMKGEEDYYEIGFLFVIKKKKEKNRKRKRGADCNGLMLSVFQALTNKASLSLPSTAGWGKENITKGS